MNNWITKALETWYKEDNPLRIDPLHPAIGLAEEAGELLGVYKKDNYKPGFDMWNCKYCGSSAGYHLESKKCLRQDEIYTPIILDELGDFSYYLRILTWQNNVIIPNHRLMEVDLLPLLIAGYDISNDILFQAYYRRIEDWKIKTAWMYFLDLCTCLGVISDEVFQLNYDKLTQNSMHGWESAR